MDERFVSKVYRTIAYTWALAMLWTMAYRKFWIALSITLGVLLGTLILVSYDLAIRRIIVPGATKPGRALWILIILKYFLVSVAIFWLIRWHKVSLIAFVGGLVLTHFAILAKLAGIRIKERLKER